MCEVITDRLKAKCWEKKSCQCHIIHHSSYDTDTLRCSLRQTNWSVRILGACQRLLLLWCSGTFRIQCLSLVYVVYFVFVCGNKMLTRCNKLFLLQISLPVQYVSGTTMPIIRSSRALYRWLLPVVFGSLDFKLSVWCGAEGYVSGLQAAAARKPDT